MFIKFKKNLTEIEARKRKLSNPNSLMDIWGGVGVRQIKRRIIKGEIKPRPKRGGKALYDTGRLAKSIHYIKTNPFTVRVIAGGKLGVRYARIHHIGGTIHGKPWLTIPAIQGLKRTQPLRVGDVIERREGSMYCKYPAKYSGWRAFWLKKSDGTLLLMASKDLQLALLFVLKHSIKIPRRRYMYFEKKDKNLFTKAAENWMKK